MDKPSHPQVGLRKGMIRKFLMCRWLPLAYREELYEVLRLTGPLLLFNILNFLLPLVISIFCGHIGTAELAGYALASATINVSAMVIVQGLTMACDTLVSQTYGSKNLKRVGIILQRSSLILLLFCLPCWALLINAQQLLLLMRQDQQVARIAQIYTTAFIPAVPAMFLHQLQVAYLQNQGIILPQMYTAALANLFNLGANYVLIISLQLGVVGSAMANSLAQVFVCLLLYAYIRWKKLHGPTWAGWSSDCLQDWGSFIKLAVPSTFMVCFEWWIWEIGGFLAGILGEVDLAAQHVMVEISAITYMCVCSGILVGCGMQKVAAMSNLVGYYCIGLPIGVALMFAAHLQIFGLWLGLLTCVTLEACFFLVLVFKLNWKKVTKEAEERAGKRVMETSKNHSMDGQETSRSQDRESEDISEKRLSTTQLVLRRGFALSAAVVTLAMGVAVHFVFPVPEIPMSGSVNLTEIWTNVSTVTPMALSQLVPADLKI
ncbi:multidrug and toxin extrusion protein 1 isoform X3 [Corythoichthys intestinalis]|uniref:multidrug and toxin extrusion protein 1 isoform X3 n=1 Tax=Corythoichthys intestinalis TaxID=161448 RepID=UPI0025A65319|nr:multidrug and toxin extrusion protein 1-like isoform X3 [Corythoichthys intestinalis]